MLTPQDYCVSLAMAQRPELHAAMKAAGMTDAPAWLYDLEYPEGQQLWLNREGYSHEDMIGSEDMPPNDWLPPAYHTGELICAALALAKGQPGAVNVAVDSALDGLAQANTCDIDARVLTICGNPHLPDAIAELVIALAKEQPCPDPRPAERAGATGAATGRAWKRGGGMRKRIPQDWFVWEDGYPEESYMVEGALTEQEAKDRYWVETGYDRGPQLHAQTLPEAGYRKYTVTELSRMMGSVFCDAEGYQWHNETDGEGFHCWYCTDGDEATTSQMSEMWLRPAPIHDPAPPAPADAEEHRDG